MDERRNSDDFDPQLEALFEREHTHVPPQPFVAATLQRVAAARRRAEWKARLFVAAAIVGVALLSPQLVAGWAWLSPRLDVLAALPAWLLSPYGIALALLAALVAFMVRGALAATAVKWARMWSER